MLDHGGSAKEEWQTLGVAGTAAGVVYATDDQRNVLQFHGGQSSATPTDVSALAAETKL